MAFCHFFAGELNKWTTSHSIWAASALAFYPLNGTDGMFPTVHFYRGRNLRFNANVPIFPSLLAAAEQWQRRGLVWRDPWKSWFKLKSVHTTPLQASSLKRKVKSVEKRSSFGLALSLSCTATALTLNSSRHQTSALSVFCVEPSSTDKWTSTLDGFTASHDQFFKVF